jgi:hypothetical protein
VGGLFVNATELKMELTRMTRITKMTRGLKMLNFSELLKTLW